MSLYKKHDRTEIIKTKTKKPIKITKEALKAL